MELCNRDKLEVLARQSLAVLILDLEYSRDLRPINGYAPIRHQVLWESIQDALGDSFDNEAAEIEDIKMVNAGPVKTNPWLNYGIEKPRQD